MGSERRRQGNRGSGPESGGHEESTSARGWQNPRTADRARQAARNGRACEPDADLDYSREERAGVSRDWICELRRAEDVARPTGRAVGRPAEIQNKEAVRAMEQFRSPQTPSGMTQYGLRSAG